MKKVFLVLMLIFCAIILAGCTSINSDSAKTKTLEDSVKKLQTANSKLSKSIEQLELKVGVYKSLNDCKEKALIDFIDKNSGVVQTTLFDAFDRCDAIFSMMKALAESTG